MRYRTARAGALVAPVGQALPTELLVGTTVDAQLCFYPGAVPLRALVAVRGELGPPTAPRADSIGAALRGYAEALAGDPWLDRWPMLLAAVVPTTSALVEEDGTALGLDPRVGGSWPLIAAAGGRPCRVMCEYGPAGARPLAAWVEGRLVRL